MALIKYENDDWICGLIFGLFGIITSTFRTHKEGSKTYINILINAINVFTYLCEYVFIAFL